MKGLKSLEVYDFDLPSKVLERLSIEKYLSIDTETGGLDYRETSLFLVQIATTSGEVFIVKKPTPDSTLLIQLIENSDISFIFHNAAFDLAFLKMGLMTEIGTNIHCTKTLMKIIFPQYSSGLSNSLKNILDIHINKQIDHSKWDQDKLSSRQLEYAAIAKFFTKGGIREKLLEANTKEDIINVFKEQD